MALAVTDLLNLDETRVSQVRDQVLTLMQEAFPDVQFDRGVIRQVLLRLFASATVGIVDENVEIYRQSTSLSLIEANPELADDELVDLVLANHRITRQSGATAAGTLTILLDRLTPVVIPSGARFEASGTTFVTESAYAAKTSSANVVLSTDRLLTDLGNGTWAFNISVVAETEGTAGMLRRGTVVTPTGTIPAFSSAYAESDFAGGVVEETNADLIQRLKDGDSIKALSNRTTDLALVRSQSAFASLLALSEVGYGDPEMQRDQHWIFPLSGGGRVDWYVRPQALPQAVTLTKTATLVEITAAGGIWQFSVGLDDAPGFYVADRVALPTAAATDEGFEVTEVVRDKDLATYAAGWQPDIETAEEAAFSRYQTAIVRFLDTATDTDGLTIYSASQDYSVTLLQMLDIDTLQAFVGDRGTRPPTCDILVKAAIPCFVTASFAVHKRATQDDPDTDAMAQALADFVNAQGFAGRLYASSLAEIAHSFLSGGMALSRIDLRGTLHCPDGSLERLQSLEVLTVPDMPEVFVSGRTVIFILDPLDVSIGVTTVDISEV